MFFYIGLAVAAFVGLAYMMWAIEKYAKFAEETCPHCGGIRMDVGDFWYCKECGAKEKEIIE